MDLQKIISDILGKLNLDTSLLEKFKKNPLETIKSLLEDIIEHTCSKGIACSCSFDSILINKTRY